MITGTDSPAMESPGEIDATQRISQSYYEEIISKSRNNKNLALSRAAEHATQSQFTLNEGDDGHIDIASSFMQNDGQNVIVEEETANFTLTQTQNLPQWTQFPESQRFKTPMTAGRKRTHDGRTIVTPVQSYNPLNNNAHTHDTGIMALSQAFAATQAASSPNWLPTNPRSDRPSPRIEAYQRPVTANSSSPLRVISEFKRAATEPVSHYVSLRQSQDLRKTKDNVMNPERELGTRDARDSESDFDDFGIVAHAERETERQQRGREELKQIHFATPQLGIRSGARNDITGHEDETSNRLSPDQSEAETEHDDEPEIAVRRSSQVHHAGILDKENAPNLVPETTFRRQHGIVSQVDGSPSERLWKVDIDPPKPGPSSSGPLRVADSQPSQPQRCERDLLPSALSDHRDDGDEIDDRDFVENAHEATKDRSNSRQVDMRQNTVMPDRAEVDSTVRAIHTPNGHNRASNLNFASTVLETEACQKTQRPSNYSISQSDPHNERAILPDIFETAYTNVRNDTATSPSHTQAVSPRRSKSAGGRRSLMAQISEESSPGKSNTQNSFNVADILERDPDRDAAAILVNADDTEHLPTATGSVSSPSENSDFRVSAVESPELSQAVVWSHRRRGEISAQDLGTPPSRRYAGKCVFDLDPSPQHRARMPDLLKNRKPLRNRRPSHRLIEPGGQQSKVQHGQCNRTTAEEGQPVLDSDVTDEKHSSSKVSAPNMVFACFNGQIRAYYPAICMGFCKSNTARYEIQFEGCEPDSVDAHGIRRLELRAGDVVKVNLEGFAKVAHIVRGFGRGSGTDAQDESISDIYGHTHLTVEPKQRKGLPRTKPTEIKREVPLRAVYLDSNMWGQMKDREYQFTQPLHNAQHGATCTPAERPSTPKTPPSRSRRQPAAPGKVTNPSTTGIFSNMAFAISLDGIEERNIVFRHVQSNGGLIVHESFSELFQNSLELKTHLSGLSFAALLTDNCTRKTKYQEALALSLPCLHTNWLMVCVKMQQIVNWFDYLLPAGESHALNGTLRSRVLPSMDYWNAKFEAMIVARPKIFDNDSVVFITGRHMEESKRASFLFILEALGAGKIEMVIDVKAAVKLLNQSEDVRYEWVFAEDKAWERSKQLILDRRGSSGPRRSLATSNPCKIARHETIRQSLILGRLYDDDVMEERTV